MISEPSRLAPRYLSDLFRNGTPAALSDVELLNRFTSRRNDHDETAELAFAALLARHGSMVLRVCRAVLGNRHELADAFQATLLVLAIRARSIRRRGSVASWLHGVALRVAAAMILAAVERIAPERLAAVFWRAVALHPRIETDREDLLQTTNIGWEGTLLARYDRDLAAALFTPMDSYLQAPAARQAAGGFINTAIWAKGCIDPRAAVALVESLTPLGDSNRSNPADHARLSLAERLGRPSEKRWMEIWRSMGAQFDD